MPPLGTQIAQPVSPASLADSYPTHYDEWGNGGFVAIATGAAAGSTASNNAINAYLPAPRRKTGMLVYDTDSEGYYRCTDGTTGLWTSENFGGGTISSVQVLAEDGLSVDNSGATTSGAATYTVGVDASVPNGVLKLDAGSLAGAVGVSDGKASGDYATATHTQAYTSLSDIPSQRLLGRSSSGVGGTEAITLGTGLSFNGSVLEAATTGGTVTSVTALSPIISTDINGDGTTFRISHSDIAGLPTSTVGSGTTVPLIRVDNKGHVNELSGFTPDFLPLAGGTVTGPVTLDGASSNLLVDGNVTVGNNLIVNGSTTTVNSETVTINDPIFTLANNQTSTPDSKDRGIEFKYGNGTTVRTGFFGRDTSTGRFTFFDTANNNGEIFTGSTGSMEAASFWVGGSEVLDGTSLGTGVVTSSLTSVGTLTAGTWQANEVGLAYGGTGADLSTEADGAIFKKSGFALTPATEGSDYLSDSSVIDGGTY